MAQRGEEFGQEDMDAVEGTDTEEEEAGKVPTKLKGKSRRKAFQRPEGSDQKRQAFSKRKRGLILKSYQLYKLTDAKVFVFIVNDKGTSWAYASPGFKRATCQEHLRQLREYANLTGAQRLNTEIMDHPSKNDTADRLADERCMRGASRGGVGGGDGSGGGGGGTSDPGEERSDGEAPAAPTHVAANTKATAIIAARAAGIVGEQRQPPPPSSSGGALNPLTAAVTLTLGRGRGGPAPGVPPPLQSVTTAVASAGGLLRPPAPPPLLLPAPRPHDAASRQVLPPLTGTATAAAAAAAAALHQLQVASGAGLLVSTLGPPPPLILRAVGPESSSGGEGAPPEASGLRDYAMHEPEAAAEGAPGACGYGPMDASGPGAYQVVMGEDGQLYRILRELNDDEEFDSHLDVQALPPMPVAPPMQWAGG